MGSLENLEELEEHTAQAHLPATGAGAPARGASGRSRIGLREGRGRGRAVSCRLPEHDGIGGWWLGFRSGVSGAGGVTGGWCGGVNRAGKRWAGLKLEVGRTGNCDRCYTGIPTGISRIKNGIQQFGQENPSPDFDPVFAVFSRIFSQIRFFPKIRYPVG